MGRIFGFLTKNHRRKGAGGSRRAFTLMEALMGAIITTTIVGGAVVYLRSGMAVTDVAEYHSMNQQAVRIPFMVVSKMVEDAAALEILTDNNKMPAVPEAGSRYICLDGRSMYFRDRKGRDEKARGVDTKIAGFERIESLKFEKIKADSAEHVTAVRMSVEAGAKDDEARLVDDPGKRPPKLSSQVDLRALSRAEVSGDQEGSVLRLEYDMLVVEPQIIRPILTNDKRLDFEADGSLKAGTPDTYVNIDGMYAGYYKVTKGDPSRLVEYEWRLYDVNATSNDIKNQVKSKYKVIGRDEPYKGEDTDLDKHYDQGKRALRISANAEGEAFTCIPDPAVDSLMSDVLKKYFEDNKITSESAQKEEKERREKAMRNRMLVPEVDMQGRTLAFAVRDATRRGDWKQCAITYPVHDFSTLMDDVVRALIPDLRDGKGRVLLNDPAGDGRITNIELKYDEESGQSYIALTGEGNLETPFISKRLTDKYFPHSRDGNNVRSREFCLENYTIWIEAEVGDGEGTMTGYGVTLNGNVSRDLTAKVDHPYGYIFQYDPGQTGYSKTWEWIGAGHENARNVSGYSGATDAGWKNLVKNGKHANFEYYWNRSTRRYFMEMAPSAGKNRVAEGLMVRPLLGGTNGRMLGVSDVMRVHKIPGKRGDGLDMADPRLRPDSKVVQKLKDLAAKEKLKEKTDKLWDRWELISPSRSQTERDWKWVQSWYEVFDDSEDTEDFYEDWEDHWADNWETWVTGDPETRLYTVPIDQIEKRKARKHLNKGDGVTIDDLAHTEKFFTGNLYLASDGKTYANHYTQHIGSNDIDSTQYYSRGYGLPVHLRHDLQNFNDYNYLRDRYVVKVVDEKDPNDPDFGAWGLRYYQWGDLVHWANSEYHWVPKDDNCDHYGKVFGVEEYTRKNAEGKDITDKRFVSMVGKRYTVEINVVTQTKAAPTEKDPDRTIPINVFCRVRVYDGYRKRVPKKSWRNAEEGYFTLANGETDPEPFPVRRFPDGTGQSRDAWFGFMVESDAKSGGYKLIPMPTPIPASQKVTGVSGYYRNWIKAGRNGTVPVNFWASYPRWDEKTKKYVNENAFIWNPRLNSSVWRHETFPIYVNGSTPSATDMSWTYRKYASDFNQKDAQGNVRSDTTEVLMSNSGKWFYGNADSLHWWEGMYPYRQMNSNPSPIAADLTASRRAEAFIVGPDVKTTRTEYNQGKANRKPTLSEAYYNVGDGKMAKLSGTIPKGDGNNVLPGDVFYRVRDEDLLTEQTLPYKKKGTGTGTGASSIGQDFALRVFGPVGAKKFTANIYYFNVEKGFPEDYIFPWGAKLTDLLPDGKGTEEPEKGRGDWNWYQAFEPVDGVKSSDVDIPF